MARIRLHRGRLRDCDGGNAAIAASASNWPIAAAEKLRMSLRSQRIATEGARASACGSTFTGALGRTSGDEARVVLLSLAPPACWRLIARAEEF